MDDEAQLETSIQEHKDQLQQIELALSVADESMVEDLVKLKGDLAQLIQLSEENLLSLKKKRLLQDLEDGSILSTSTTVKYDRLLKHHHHDQHVASTSNIEENETSAEVENTLEDHLAALEGTKCRAPFSQSWGEYSYHNALVLSVEPCNEIESSDDIKVRVLFCNPTHDSMKPCPYFLEGNCRFPEEKCRFSHGFLVSLDELKEFQFPDYKRLEVNRKCLAQHTDGIWYPATVVSIEDNEYSVHFDQYGSDAAVSLEQIIPFGDSHSELTTSESDDDSEPVKYDANDSNCIPSDAWSQSYSNSVPLVLGQWEQYTKGIGSKLMAKMGYISGQGLGKHGEGRLDPVEARILPPGKSLDKCMEMRELQQSQDPIRRMKRLKRNQRRQEAKIASGYNRTPRTNVFDFLNKKLSHPENNSHKVALAQDPTLKSASVKNLNIKSFQLGEDITKIKKEIWRLKTAIQRNAGNKSVQLQLQAKLRATQAELETLKKGEVAVRKEQTIRKDNRKLTIF